MSDTVLITRSSSSTESRIVRGAAEAPVAPSAAVDNAEPPYLRRRAQAHRSDALSSPAGISSPASIAGDHLADPVDDRKHCADQRSVGRVDGRHGHRRAHPRRHGSAPRAAGIRRSRNCPSRCGRSGKCYRGARGRPARASQATISPPRASSISRHSATKSAIRSSIGEFAPQSAA